MAVDLRTPDRIEIRLTANAERDEDHGVAAAVVDVAVRGLLTGIGAALVMFAGDRVGVASVTVLGVLALGAALVEWNH
jgi:tetrahydromethanopterin S-methyltransferase subunit D